MTFEDALICSHLPFEIFLVRVFLIHFLRRTANIGRRILYLSTLSLREGASLSRSWYQKILSGTSFLLRVSIAGVEWKDKGGDVTETNICFFRKAHQLLCGL